MVSCQQNQANKLDRDAMTSNQGFSRWAAEHQQSVMLRVALLVLSTTPDIDNLDTLA